jgi:hypothetical protein
MSDSEASDAEESKVEIQAGHRAIHGAHGTRTTKVCGSFKSASSVQLFCRRSACV